MKLTSENIEEALEKQRRVSEPQLDNAEIAQLAANLERPRRPEKTHKSAKLLRAQRRYGRSDQNNP